MRSAQFCKHQHRLLLHSLLLSTGWDAVRYIFVMITLILLSSKTDENPSPEVICNNIWMGNADEYLLIITLHFPASGSQLHHGAAQPTRLVLRMMPGLGSCCLMPGYLLSACSGLFGFLIIHWFQTPGMSWGFFVCLFVLGGCFGFFFTDFISGI